MPVTYPIGGDSLSLPKKTVKFSSLNHLSSITSGGIIQFEDNTQYEMLDSIDFGTNRVVFGEQSSLTSPEALIYTMTYSGTEPFLNSNGKSIRISNIGVDAPNATVFNIDDSTATSPSVVRLSDVSGSGSKIMDVIGVEISGGKTIIRATNVSIAATNGVSFSGVIGSFLWEISASSITSGAFWDWGTAVFDAWTVNGLQANLGTGCNYISGLTNSANISPGGFAQINTTRFVGDKSNLLVGVAQGDSRIDYIHNDIIEDSAAGAFLTIQDNTTPLTLTVGVPVKITGPWSVQRVSRLTADTTGTISVNSERPEFVKAYATVTVDPASGQNITISAYIYQNGSPLPGAKGTIRVDAGDPKQILVLYETDITQSNNDIEVWLANETNSTSIIPRQATHLV